MFSASIIFTFIASLWGSGAVLGWLVRIGLVPFIPVLAPLASGAFELFGGLMRWLGSAAADCFEKPSRLVIITLAFYGGAWHFADWRPWHGLTKEKAAAHRVVKAAPAPKVAAKPAKRKTDTRSIIEKHFNIF